MNIFKELRKQLIYSYYYNDSSYSLETWFFFWLWCQNFSNVKQYSPKNCYYEFGTGSGQSLDAFLKAANRFCKKFNFDKSKIRIFLFDSFQGLPEVTTKEDDLPGWKKGLFSYSKDYIANIVKANKFPLSSFEFIEGFFEESLNTDTFKKIKDFPPSIVNLDVDYYSSTKIALEFIAPILQSGTVFYFDDLYSFFLHPEMGQVKALSEFNKGETGTLNLLTQNNYAGKCYIFTRKEWEHLRRQYT